MIVAMVNYRINTASASQIADHLLKCDTDFTPPLSDRVEIDKYAMKIASKATRFEAYSDGVLIGLVAAYMSSQHNDLAYITNVSLVREWTGKGIASRLVSQCIEYAKTSAIRQIDLEVADANAAAIKLYKRLGFVADNANTPFVAMTLHLTNRSELGPQS